MSGLLRIPTFKRQKFLLAFIKTSGGSLTEIDLQKLLFLFHQHSQAAFYEFVPYLSGCYSFQAAQDLDTLQSMNWLRVTKEEICMLSTEVPKEWGSLWFDGFFDNHAHRGTDLLKKVYREY